MFRGDSANDFPGEPEFSCRRQKLHRKFSPRRSGTLRTLECGAALSQKWDGECRPMSPVLTKTRKKPPGTWNDTRLVKACLSGDEEAWSLLIDKYKALIYSIPVKYGLSGQEAADVFQATCTELLLRLPDLREPRALPKWLMQVAHHESYRWKRQSQRTVSRDDAETELPDPATPAIADSLVQQTQEQQLVREAMSVLNPPSHRLLTLPFF